MVDRDHRVAGLNRAAQALFGAGSMLVGMPLRRLLPGYKRPEVLIASAPPVESELVWESPSPRSGAVSQYHFRVQCIPLEDEDGTPQGYALMLQDQTGSREVETTLRQQKEFYESVVRHSPVAIVTISREFRVLSWNPAAERLFGFSPQEALGANILHLVANADEVREEGERASREVVALNRVKSVTRRVRKDGSIVDVELLALPVTVGGQQLGYIAIYHDITDLQRARQAAEAANEAKSLFLATMSHEIRTPMNAIIGMTGLLLDTPLTPEQRDFVSTVRQSGDALLALLNDILDLSKIEAGKLELERHPFDLRQCVESVLDLLAARASEKGLDLGCLVAPHTPQLLVGDAARLRQVLLNLVGNALKFTDKGGVAVSVEVTRRPEDGEGPYELRFSVQDTGPGIPASKRTELFQPFIQLDSSVPRRFGGTGLGLAICKRLVEAMGGRIWVESEGVPGRGTTFHFTLTAPAEPQTAAGYLNPEQPLLRGKRVLLVDDNPISRRLLGLQLRNWGLEFIEAGSGAEALARLDAGTRFDLAIVDHQMPLLDGPALAVVIRQRHDARRLPLLLLTSLGKREPQSPGTFSSVITRPVKASQLYDALVTCVSSDTLLPAPNQVQSGREGSAFGRRLGETLPLRILLAEDNATNQKLALLVLERLGYRAEVAASGREALRALARQRFDVILMDMQMPEMDGLEATRRIRREVALAEQPWIIAMTANAMDSDRRLCIEAGMNDFLTKPLNVEALIAALQRCQPQSPGSPLGPSSNELAVALQLAAPAPVSSGLASIPGLDSTALLRLWDGLGEQAPQAMGELIDTALMAMPVLLGEARTALERRNSDDLGRAAHTLKSNAAYFGANGLETVCREIERLADSRKLDGLDDMLGQCEAELSKTRMLLIQLRETLPT